MEEKGQLIVFEGIDGCGKSTIVSMVGEKLKAENVPLIVTKEPSDDEIGNLIHSYLCGEKRINNPYTIQLLNMADRMEHIADPLHGIVKHINEGTHVICDRFFLSSVVYASYRYLDKELLTISTERSVEDIILNEINSNFCLYRDYPILYTNTHTIFLKIDPLVSLERISLRNKERNEHNSIFETKEKLINLSKAYDIAIKIINEWAYPVHIIDANRPLENVINDVFAVVNELI